MLDLTSLQERHLSGETFEFLFFWGHQPSKDGKVGKSCLSQWYAASFTLEGDIYPTAEHYMMASKARLFGDDESLAKILEAPDPKRAKALGRKVANFEEAVWKENARRLVTEGNIAKFSQNEGLKSFLLETGERVLVEASPYDRVWGIGLKASDKRAKDPANWEGENLLGFALMDVRDELS